MKCMLLADIILLDKSLEEVNTKLEKNGVIIRDKVRDEVASKRLQHVMKCERIDRNGL